jgi:hypothetical protein
MTKQLALLLFVVFSYQVHAQVVRHPIIGRVVNDSVSVESIHILNKNTKKGTISNQYGIFKIPVKENDTLIFEGIQFKKKALVITKHLLKNKSFDVTLIQNINELQTVEIKNTNLEGDLRVDAKNVKKPINMIASGALDFSHIDFNVVDDIDAIDRSKAPNPFKGTSAQVQKGANLMFILTPILNGLSKIGQKKRRLKKAQKEREKIALTVPDKIRKELGDAFFVEQLKIPRDQIDAFILYCQPKGLVDLYMVGKKLEMIQVLVDETERFKAFLKSQK